MSIIPGWRKAWDSAYGSCYRTLTLSPRRQRDAAASHNPQHHRHLPLMFCPILRALHLLMLPCLCQACAFTGNSLPPFSCAQCYLAFKALYNSCFCSTISLTCVREPLSCHLAPLALSACSKGLRAEWAQP